MLRCPITYLEADAGKYSHKGLKKLSPNLKQLNAFPYSAQQQRMEAGLRMRRMSIQGVQPKLSAVLNTRKQTFEIVDLHGRYIIKPQNDTYPQLPENEDLTMKLAAAIGIEVPLHGMIYSQDGSLSYIIKRFDRVGRNKKLAVEDFAQLAALNRDTKYDYSLEKVVKLIEEYCTFPLIEKFKFFRLILFCFITGNEDMHLKNFSLITRNNKVEFSPAYDLLNTTIAMGGAEEESALTLAGKRRNLRKRELIDYFGKERLGLNETVIKETISSFRQVKPDWLALIDISFMEQELKDAYISLLTQRFSRLDWN